jgi:ribosomal protein S18 acetylase RimI-like enzyme
MNNEITIEPYQSELDYPAIEKILQTYPHITYEAMGYAKGTTKRYLESDKYQTDVLIYNNQTVGFVNYTSYNWHFLTFFLGRYGLIHLIGIDQEYQNKGFGSQLLQHALQKLEEQKTPTISLMVKSDNINAQKLYEKEGFTCPIPKNQRHLVSQLAYQKSINISPDELPQGNIIQQYPRTFMTTILVGCGAAAYAKFKS